MTVHDFSFGLFLLVCLIHLGSTTLHFLVQRVSLFLDYPFAFQILVELVVSMFHTPAL